MSVKVVGVSKGGGCYYHLQVVSVKVVGIFPDLNGWN